MPRPQIASACNESLRFAMGIAGIALLTGCGDSPPAPRTAGKPLRQHAYVWQRDWNGAVRGAVAEHGHEFSGLAVLGAQVSWERDRVKYVRPPVNWTVLAQTNRSVSAVVRIERPVPVEAVPALASLVIAEAQRLVESAKATGLTLAEVQVDYDAPQKKLTEYTPWLRAVERGLEPLPVRITTLASWLAEPEFRTLIAACDGYILQVHSFDPPAPGQRATVCDAAKTRAWVKQAAAQGQPFHVALPTYRTTAGYDASGKLLGVATDGPAPEWPAGTVRQEFPSDAAALAGLVAEWQQQRPAELEGIFWYRLPVASDTRNWRWPALAAVMLITQPGRANFIAGQVALPLTLALFGALHWARSKPWFSGLMLTLASFKPTFGVPLGLLMLCRGDFRAAGLGALLSSLIAAAGLLVIFSRTGDLANLVPILKQNQHELEAHPGVNPATSTARIDGLAATDRWLGKNSGSMLPIAVPMLVLSLAGLAVWKRAGDVPSEGAIGPTGLIMILATLLSIYHLFYDALPLWIPILSLVVAPREVWRGYSVFSQRLLLVLLTVPILNVLCTLSFKAALDRLVASDFPTATNLLWALGCTASGMSLVAAFLLAVTQELMRRRNLDSLDALAVFTPNPNVTAKSGQSSQLVQNLHLPYLPHFIDCFR